MSSYIPIITVAALSLIGNIVYFNFQFRKQSKKEILKLRLTNLLLPLFINLKHDEINLAWAIKFDDPGDFDSEKPTRLRKKLNVIIKDNLYLADDELHGACLSFLNWSALSDDSERYQNIMNNIDIDDKDFEKFKEVVYKKYNEERQKYLS